MVGQPELTGVVGDDHRVGQQAKREPDRKRARMLRARFDRIFTKNTGYVMLDRLLARLHARKAEQLRVLDRPTSRCTPTDRKNDIRSVVTKRKISGGTVSERGKIARDVMLGLIKTCAKLNVSFYRLLGDRLAVPNAPHVPACPVSSGSPPHSARESARVTSVGVPSDAGSHGGTRFGPAF